MAFLRVRSKLLAATLVVVGCESSISPRDASTADTATERVTISIKATALVVGQEVQLNINGVATNVVWQSDNPTVVAVSSDGMASAEAPGKARIVVRAQMGTDTAFITVRQRVASVRFAADSIDLGNGETGRLAFRALDANGDSVEGFDESPIQWESASPSIASVDSSGVISALSVGAARIVVAVDGTKDSALVRVVPSHVAAIVLSVPAQFSLAVGDVYQIHAYAKDASGDDLPDRAIVWSSSNPSVAAVSQGGSVTAMNPGLSIISGSTEGQHASTTVFVSKASVGTVTTSLASTNLAPGQTTQGTAVARDAEGDVLSGRAVAWSSMNPNIATVSSKGLVTAIATGTAEIRATVEGKTGDGVLTVTAPVVATTASVVATIDSTTLAPGHSAHGRAVPKDAQGNVLSGKTASWSSKNSEIVTVDPATGVVTAVSAGTVVIQAIVDGIAGQTSVNVSSPSVIPEPPASGGTLVSHDFEDGTLGGYYNPWGVGIDVVDDPTGAGHGKVARMHYSADGVTQPDDNKALLPKTSFAIALGDSLWFRGDFYLPATLNDDPSVSLRKLVKWGYLHDQWHFPEQSEMTLALAGAQVQVTNTVVGPSNLPPDYSYTGFNVTKGAWHRLEIQLRMNTTFAAKDGVLRVWVDGALIYDRTDLRWTDPLWPEDQSTFNWPGWGAGDQMQARAAYDEYRYWDNMIYSKSRTP